MSCSKDSSQHLRTAVVLHGLVHRSLRHTIDRLRECVIAPLDGLGAVDIFYHSWEVQTVHNPRGSEHGEALDLVEVEQLLPEAQGVFESQDAFDATVEWRRLLRKNPMRHCCGSDEEAEATLMNFRRALESQERAWRFFEERKTQRYDLVVATRADLRFLEVGRWDENATRLKNGGQECHPSLWLPKVHSWGGVNDRFAIGNEESIKCWLHHVMYQKPPCKEDRTLKGP